MTTTTLDEERVGAFAQRVADMLAGGATAAMMVVGDRLGLYAALAAGEPQTSRTLADRTGTHERYVREWLAQQAAAGFVDYDPVHHTFTLPREHAAVLASDDSPAAMIGAAPLVTGLHRRTDELTAAFRTGRGIPWSDQDPTIFESAERFFTARYRANLVPEWIAALDGVSEKLRQGAHVADVGCGHGAPEILMARAYEASRFVGFDSHEPSIATARRRAADAGVSDRVSFEVADSHNFPPASYDLICFFDAFHDLGDPAGAAAYARDALDDDGTLMLVEPRAGDDLASTLDMVPMAALSFAASTFLCTPNSLSQPGAAGLGSQAGPRRLIELLHDAGFRSVRVGAENQVNMVLEARP